METILFYFKKVIPHPLLKKLRPGYHFLLAWVGSVIYHHPSKKLVVIAVTGTKGKSSVTEIITHILETDGKKVASLSTIQFKIADDIKRNLYKMTMPGRFFVQKFVREAVAAGCTHAVI